METVDFQLQAALQSSINEEELVTDILQACKEAGVRTQHISEWSSQDVQQRLFLTPEEADKLLVLCKQAFADASAATKGPAVQHSNTAVVEVHAGDVGHLSELNMVTSEEARRASRIMIPHPDVIQEEKSGDVSNDDAAGAGIHAELQQVDENITELKLGSDNFCNEPFFVHKVDIPVHEEEVHDVPAIERCPSPKAQAAAPKNKNKARPHSASLPSMPSYLRSTKASDLRSSKQLEPEDLRASSKPSPAKKQGNFISRLLAPTASFVSRITSMRSESKEAKQAKEAAESLRRSQQLSALLKAPHGQRVTRPQPFMLSTELRPKSATVSTDELRMMEAQKVVVKRREVPADLRESKRLDGFARVVSSPRDPSTVFKPFQLSSMEKHEKYQSMRSARLEEEAKAAEEARRFKASQLDKSMLTSPVSSPTKKKPTPVTTPVAVKLASAARAEHHAKVVEPLKRARMSEAERQALEDRERRAEEEAAAALKAAEEAARDAEEEAALAELSVQEYRKRLAFKARDMPDFSSPFKPDSAKAAPVTQTEGFNLRTVERLGEHVPVRDRVDMAAPSLTSSVVLMGGSVGGVYAGSLRSSSSATGAFSPAKSLRTSRDFRASIQGGLSPVSKRPGSAASNLRASTSALYSSSSSSAGTSRPGSAVKRGGPGSLNRSSAVLGSNKSIGAAAAAGTVPSTNAGLIAAV